MESTIQVGRSIKSFGKEGYIRVHIEDSYRDDVAKSKYLFVNIEGCFLPYFIEAYDKDSSLLKFDEIDNPQDVRLLSDTELFLFKKDINILKPIINDPEIIGYLLKDQNDKPVGIINDIIEMPMQVLLEVQKETRMILVPFHQNILLEFDPEKNVVKLQIAEGLEDI